MNRRSRIIRVAAAVLALCAFAPPARTQVNQRLIREGVWNTSLASALSVSRYTGRPVLVFFFEDWCGYCEQMEQVLVHNDVKPALKRFILVKTRLEDNPELAREYKVDVHHQVVMLDWSGRAIGKITDMKDPRDVALRVTEAAAVNDLLAGSKLEELGYYSKAAQRYEFVTRLSRDEKTVEQAKKSLERLRERSRKHIDLIKQLIRKGRNDEAVDACTEFLNDFPNEMGREEVEGLLVKLKSGRPIPDRLGGEEPVEPAPEPGVKPEDEARKTFEQGMVYEWDKRYYDAVTNYRRVMKRFAGTPSRWNRDAEKRLELLLDDPETRVLVEKQKTDQECSRLLEMGKLYEKNGRDEQALKYYSAIITSFPDSPWAVQAKQFLDAIEKRAKP